MIIMINIYRMKKAVVNQDTDAASRKVYSKNNDHGRRWISEGWWYIEVEVSEDGNIGHQHGWPYCPEVVFQVNRMAKQDIKCH